MSQNDFQVDDESDGSPEAATASSGPEGEVGWQTQGQSQASRKKSIGPAPVIARAAELTQKGQAVKLCTLS